MTMKLTGLSTALAGENARQAVARAGVWMLFGLVAVHGLLAGQAAGQEPPPEAELAEPLFELPPTWLGDLDGLLERRLIRIGTTLSQTHFFLDGATQRGLVPAAMREFETHVNQALGTRRALRVRIAIVPLPRDRLLPALLEGHIDIAVANLTVTPERLETVAFSNPIAINVAEIVVAGPAAPPLASLDDLAGTTLHLRRSSSYWGSVERLNNAFGERGLQPVRLVEVEEHLEDEDLLELVAVGVLPFTVVDKHLADFWVTVFDGLVAHPELALSSGGRIAWALRPDTPELTAMVNGFVGQIRRGSLTGNVLLGRYLRNNRWVHNPAATGDRRRFEASMNLFKEYADQYNFDWLMLTALAYQESRIDQSVRSPAGAIGIMQLMPSTAADPVVGIPDISTPRNNIHAGARYLRWLTDVHLNEPALDDFNRMLLAFAAYNAGPRNLTRIRRRTEEMGLDPDVWFGNVELGAARIIGRETVSFVKNITKYYFAFRLIVAEMEARERARQDLMGARPQPPLASRPPVS